MPRCKWADFLDIVCAICSVSGWLAEKLCVGALMALWAARRLKEGKRYACIWFCCWLYGVAERSELTDLSEFLSSVCSVSRQKPEGRCGDVMATLRCMLGVDKRRKNQENNFVAGVFVTAGVQDCYIIVMRSPFLRAIPALRWDSEGNGAVWSTSSKDGLLSYLCYLLSGLYCGDETQADVVLWYVK